MTRLLRSDLFKLRKSKSFWVCMTVAFFLGILMTILYYAAYQSIGANIEATKKMVEGMGAYAETINEALEILPDTNLWAYINVSLCDLNVMYLAAIIIGIFVGSEYNMGTIRNAVSRGYSRQSIIFSKLCVSTVSMLLIVTAYVIGGAVPGVIMFGFSSSVSIGNILLVLLCYLILFIAASSFYVMMTTMAKKTGYAIALSMIVPMVILSAAKVIEIGYRDFSNVTRFWIFQTITETQKLCLSGRCWIPMVVGAVYFLICSSISLLIIRHQELGSQ